MKLPPPQVLPTVDILLEKINILNGDGTMNENAGSYQGLSIAECRKQVVADMENLGLVDKVVPHEIELPHSDRSKTPIEPLLANQWFVRMSKLAQTAMDAVSDGRVRITPERFERSYHDWLAEKRDWPVSRQLWWGHQIPVWSKNFYDASEVDTAIEKIRGHKSYTADTIAWQNEDPRVHADGTDEAKKALPLTIVHVCIRDDDGPIEWIEEQGFTREPDVLDTWFSSALWPFATMGWPDEDVRAAGRYPNDILISGFDILFFWDARLLLPGMPFLT